MKVREFIQFLNDYGMDVSECEMVIEASVPKSNTVGSSAACLPKVISAFKGFDWNSGYLTLQCDMELKVKE